MTDTRGNWASPWIQAVSRAGIMEAYPNHTFQPNEPVRRGDLALAAVASAVVHRDGAAAPGGAWKDARVRFSDLPPGHLSYPAAAVAVQSGVMKPVERRRVPADPAGDRSRGARRGQEARRARRGASRDEPHGREPADAAADAAGSAVRHPAAVRPPGLGARDLLHRRRDRSVRRADRPPHRPEDDARGVAGSDGRQAAARDDVRHADAAGHRAQSTACRCGSPSWCSAATSRSCSPSRSSTWPSAARTFRPSIFGKIATATYVMTGVITLYFNSSASVRTR